MKKRALKSRASSAYFAGCCMYRETTMASMRTARNGGSLQAMVYCHRSDGLSATKVVARIVVVRRVL